MHEMSLMADLLRKIEQVARAEGATRVTRVRVHLGALSHISAEHFTEHFVIGTQGTLAEGAAVDVTVGGDEAAPDAQDIRLTSLVVE